MMDDFEDLFKAFEGADTPTAKRVSKPAVSAAAPDATPPSMWDSIDEPSIALPKMTGRKPSTRPIADPKPAVSEDELDLEFIASGATASAFPVGWLIVIEGKGRGACFTLKDGVSTIGRDAAETVSLNFGDTGISPSIHASVAYDSDEHVFYIGHGGKKDIVRKNGKPVLSTEVLEDGSIIGLGGTKLRFVALCNDSFNWKAGSEN